MGIPQHLTHRGSSEAHDLTGLVMMHSIETIIWVHYLVLFMETGGTSRLSEALRQSVVAHRLGLVMQHPSMKR